MVSRVIIVDNLIFGGCANTIAKSLSAIEGVKVLAIDPDTSHVTASMEADAQLEAVKQRLLELGYPEKGTVHGLSGVSAGARSYLSCAVGWLGTRPDKIVQN